MVLESKGNIDLERVRFLEVKQIFSDIIFDINESIYTPFIHAVTFENEKR